MYFILSCFELPPQRISHCILICDMTINLILSYLILSYLRLVITVGIFTEVVGEVVEGIRRWLKPGGIGSDNGDSDE